MNQSADAEAAAPDGPSEPEGRSARAQRTRGAVVDALVALLREGTVAPGAREVAERAGVSTRTVFAHFATLEDLYQACVEQATATVLSLLTPVDPGLPLAERIDDVCTQRARVNEEIGPMRRAAALKAPFSPALARTRAYARRASYEQLDRVFATELDALASPARRRRRASVDALLSGETWDLLRDTHGLAVDEALPAVREAVRALLPPVATATPDSTSATTGPPDPTRAARRAAAQRTLDDIERRIDRLVAAIEAGSPGDLLAPRLQALRSARLEAEHALGPWDAGGR